MFTTIKRWIKKFLGLFKSKNCKHEWECVHQMRESVIKKANDTDPDKITLTKTMKCKKCGELEYIKEDIK